MHLYLHVYDECLHGYVYMCTHKFEIFKLSSEFKKKTKKVNEPFKGKFEFLLKQTFPICCPKCNRSVNIQILA